MVILGRIHCNFHAYQKTESLLTAVLKPVNYRAVYNLPVLCVCSYIERIQMYLSIFSVIFYCYLKITSNIPGLQISNCVFSGITRCLPLTSQDTNFLFISLYIHMYLDKSCFLSVYALSIWLKSC